MVFIEVAKIPLRLAPALACIKFFTKRVILHRGSAMLERDFDIDIVSF